MMNRKKQRTVAAIICIAYFGNAGWNLITLCGLMLLYSLIQVKKMCKGGL